MMRSKRLGWLAALVGVVGCVNGMPTETEPDDESVTQVSPQALEIEQAERVLDRGGDRSGAIETLERLVTEASLTTAERHRAALALSRAYEADQNTEQAIAVIERELAAHADDRSWDDGPFVRRLRKLLTGSETLPGAALESQAPVAPFAHVVAEAFEADRSGVVQATLLLAGGDGQLSGELGTYNVRGALEDEARARCPLCDVRVSVSQRVLRGDWTIVPQQQQHLDEALLVFYFDLRRNRVPARYEHHLPMPVADVVAELERGRSFVVAKERPGAPPTLLLAAPRTAMLPDVERYLAGLEELPTEVRYTDAYVSAKLRPEEIRAVVRGQWLPKARTCYEQLLARDPDADGKLVIKFAIAGSDGSVEDVRLDASEAGLGDEPFVQCVEQSAAAMRFPAAGEGRTTVAYPLHFSP